MRIRRIINLLAVLAVLLHAGAVVRHSLTVLAVHQSSEQALLADLGVICHAGQDDAGATSAGTPPSAPSPASLSKCPICLSLTAPFVLASSTFDLTPPATGPPVRLVAFNSGIANSPVAGLLPPVRGPPAV